MSLLERPVTFRLSAEKYAHYQAEAHRRGMKLSLYLRLRLEAEDGVAEQINQLRLALLDDSDDGGSALAPLALEQLLLTRQFASPAALRGVHEEMKRLGVRPWTPDNN